ncbi:hypothetical protein FP2506_00185 [Fulvimarina pelagi HTCC2506]|uniref:Uncharacterized protein n=1 Tax=Fulvimarina pelagi HTCC2506 TaxID=314231 RepID=Q0FXU8_9HYPH|nr:hypothetical protein [Fulvimarina pelagi]EAU39785.1 hypothetical protein FP2506_00185 [Fulvimarina pelagi HTCC2506]
MRILITATLATMIASTASYAAGLVPGSEAGIVAHETAERMAVTRGGHVAAGSADHTILQHGTQTFGYSDSATVISDHNLIPGSEAGLERSQEKSRRRVASDKYHNQAPVAETQLGRRSLVPGTEDRSQ